MNRVLLLTGAMLALPSLGAAASRQYSYTVDEPGEVIASLRMRSPGADWAVEGREAALVTVTVDGQSRQNVMLFAGDQPFDYKIFLGANGAGKHTIEISRKLEGSAHEAEAEVLAVEVKTIGTHDPYYPIVANAPVLFARLNTIGKFTDVPMLQFCEKLTEAGLTVLQYSVIFTNEDGGTSTRRLMARWGRTTDIEYVYKLFLNEQGSAVKRTIQAKDHKEVPFEGAYFGGHPLLIPVTDNNMVGPGQDSPVHYQMQPMLVDLRAHSREWVMDQLPLTYQVMRKELIREGKLREYGITDGEKISDPVNYVYIEYKLRNKDSRTAVAVRKKGGKVWFSSHLGRLDSAIERDGWARIAIEVPPGTRSRDLAEIGFECFSEGNANGRCAVEQGSLLFMLQPDGKPGPTVPLLLPETEVPAGQMVTFPISQ